MPINMIGLIAVLYASTIIDEYSGEISDVAQFGAVTGGVYFAYRIVKSAHRDAITLYKEAAADADTRLDREREQWAKERAELMARIDGRLSRENQND